METLTPTNTHGLCSMTISRHGTWVAPLKPNGNADIKRLLTKYPLSYTAVRIIFPNANAVYKIHEAPTKEFYVATRRNDFEYHEVCEGQAKALAAGAKFEDVMGDKVAVTHGRPTITKEAL